MLNRTGGRPSSLLQEQNALNLLHCFYERWAASFHGREALDHAGLAEWIASRFETIERLVMGRPDDPLLIGLVAVAQAEPVDDTGTGYSVLSRASRFHRSLRFDSPHVALFPTEELAMQAAGKARNRRPAAALFLVHLSLGVVPVPTGDDDRFAVKTNVRARAFHPDLARC